VRLAAAVGAVMGLVGFAAIGGIAHAARSLDVNEPHTVVMATSMGELVPIGSTVLVECQLPAGGYLAEHYAAGNTMLVFTVTTTQLDSAPTGPFPESCEHWQKRHRVADAASGVPGSLG
jgi:hypothetical protein